ncbi:hypothetical protein GCM10011415_28260 [Salipiger pallidus]|uniref:Uncharacterized protein n=1 Tax=Salipiger pallidus TaxID=1775170 RepID=A0A8J2ZLH4_9RHOB|nr:hypothetical protein [Salipiger pallidus]GGG77690.1 hypothetical protein GCM10011415_28260 [Salipiger pallidus]
MSFSSDLLGRQPIMRPIGRNLDGMRAPFRRAVREGKVIVGVPYASFTIQPSVASVSLPRAPWEESA